MLLSLHFETIDAAVILMNKYDNFLLNFFLSNEYPEERNVALNEAVSNFLVPYLYSVHKHQRSQKALAAIGELIFF